MSWIVCLRQLLCSSIVFYTCSLCRVEQVTNFPVGEFSRGLCPFLVCCVAVTHSIWRLSTSNVHSLYMFSVSRELMADAASEVEDADSSGHLVSPLVSGGR